MILYLGKKYRCSIKDPASQFNFFSLKLDDRCYLNPKYDKVKKGVILKH